MQFDEFSKHKEGKKLNIANAYLSYLYDILIMHRWRFLGLWIFEVGPYDDLLSSSERENDDFVEKLRAEGLRELLRVLSWQANLYSGALQWWYNDLHLLLALQASKHPGRPRGRFGSSRKLYHYVAFYTS